MLKSKIDILFLQEANTKLDYQDTRKEFTWFFSGTNTSEDRTHGVGIVISNQLLNYMADIQPINDRLVTLTLGCSIPVNFICAYAPPSTHDTENKKQFYDQLQTLQDKLEKEGPTFLFGDAYARIQKKSSSNEACVGPYTFDKENPTAADFKEGMIEDRNLFIAHCSANNHVIVNTFFQKPQERLITFMNCRRTRTENDNEMEIPAPPGPGTTDTKPWTTLPQRIDGKTLF